jgi:hypothetical protein
MPATRAPIQPPVRLEEAQCPRSRPQADITNSTLVGGKT